MGLQKEKLLDIVQVTEVSTTTGEAFTYEKNIYDKEIHQANVEYKLSEKELHQYINEMIGNFFFYFYNKLDALEIEDQYKIRFIYLASFLDYNSDIIIDKTTGKKVSLSYDGLKSYLNLSDREFKYTIKAFKDNNLIYKDGVYYKINTDYAIKGENKKINDKYTRVFIDTIRDLYINTKPRNHKQLYYFFKLLPYVNLQFNVITNDITNEVQCSIKPLSMKDICNIIGLNPENKKRIYNSLKTFQIGEEYVICKHEINNMEAYSINPKLYYMGTQIENLLYLTNLFEMSKSNQ